MPNAMCTDSGFLNVIDAGTVAYGEMLQRQKSLFDAMVDRKKTGLPAGSDTLILVEHEPVFTIGRHGKESNMLVSEQYLASRGIELVHIGRGGDITFHGPGQLVAYPVIDMQRHSLGVKQYIWCLEEAVIRTLADYGIRGERVDGATGVWIDKALPSERKICAIGVKCSRFVTMHGLALNVNTDLSYFTAINPCGFTDKGVTSIERELGRKVPMDDVKKRFVSHFKNVIG